MAEVEQSLNSKEDRLKNDADPPDSALRQVSAEIRNGDGNVMEEIKNSVDDNNSSEELKVVAEAKRSGDIKDGEDEKNLEEVRVMEERNSVQQIKNGDEDKDIGESEVVVEKEAMEAVNGEEKEGGEGKKNLDIARDEESKKEVDVHNGNEMKLVVEGKDGEEHRVLERLEDARDEKSLEDVKYNNEEHGLGDVEAMGGKSDKEGRNAIDDVSVKELKNGKDVVEEMKDDEHGKPISGEKDEDGALAQVEENGSEKVRNEAKDMEMMGTEDVVEKEAPDVKDEEMLVVRDGEEEEKDNGGRVDNIVGDNEKTESLKRNRSRDRGPFEIGDAKKNGNTKENVEELEVQGSAKRSKEVLSTPVVSPSDRPVRERKTVERLVEVIEKGSDRTIIIEKGRGTPLSEIPHVANNLGRKKPAELKFLHQTLFGRKGKMIDFKNNLLQFSGFTWHESEEKQRAKIKEKLDKCVKETLLDLCEFFDLTVSKTHAKKDEIIVKLLDFLEAPQAMSNAMNAENQSFKSRKRERVPEVDSSKSSGGHSEKRPKQGHEKTKGTPSSDDAKDEEDEDEDLEEQSQRSHSENDASEIKELKEIGDEEEEDEERKVDANLRKGKQVKKSPKHIESQDPPTKKASSKIGSKSSLKTPSKHPKAEKSEDGGAKAFSKKNNDAKSPKKSNSKSNSKEKSSGKASKGKAKSGRSVPTKAELKESICKVLKEVDFNTATFTDILKELSSEYKTDLTPRKAAIKLMIQDELTKLAEQEEEEEDEEDEEEI